MRANNYSLGILFTTLVGIGISIALLLLQWLASISAPLWLLILICGSSFILTVSQLVSGVGYICRGVDTVTHENTALDLCSGDLKRESLTVEGFKKRINFKFIGIVLGMIAAVAITIAMAVLQVSLPFTAILGTPVSGVISFIGFASVLAGFGNRAGDVLDYIAERNGPEKKPFFRRPGVNYVLGVIGGMIGGIALTVVVFVVVHAMPIITMFSAIPMWMTAGLFAIMAISVCASAGGYVGRSFDTLLGDRTVVGAVNDALENRPDDRLIEETPKPKPRLSKESLLTMVGLLVGITLGSIFIYVGVLTVFIPYIHVSKIILDILLMATFVSGFGGLGNRIGSVVDRSEKQASFFASGFGGLGNRIGSVVDRSEKQASFEADVGRIPPQSSHHWFPRSQLAIDFHRKHESASDLKNNKGGRGRANTMSFFGSGGRGGMREGNNDYRRPEGRRVPEDSFSRQPVIPYKRASSF